MEKRQFAELKTKLLESAAELARRQTDVAADHRGPLAHLQPNWPGAAACAGFEIQPLRRGLVAEVRPAFKRATDDLLVELRHDLLVAGASDATWRWIEALMRFCEIRRRDVKSVAQSQFGKGYRAGVVHVAALLLDAHQIGGDLRYANTALKLMDLKWAFDPTAMRRAIERRSDPVWGLFGARLVVASDALVQSLCEAQP